MEKEPECPDEVLRRLPSYEEIREYVLRVSREPVVLPKSAGRKGLLRHRIKVERVHGYIARNVLEPLRTLRNVLGVSFYERIASNALPEGVSAKEVVGRLLGKLGVVEKLSREYRLRISASFDAVEAGELYREYVGRVMSIVRRQADYIELANRAIAELRRTPCVDPELPVVAVAGLPQVGKSTLVSAISTAKPRSSPFPFTTKEIVMGHVTLGLARFQILDLPGILDRLPEEMNEIERKAFIAVTETADLVLFVIDPSEGFYYGLESQLNLLGSLRRWVKADVIVVVNKVDRVSRERVEEVSRAVAGVLPGAEVVAISALRGEGLDDMLSAVARRLGGASEREQPEDEHRRG